MRSADADIAEIRIPRQFPSDSLHGIVDRFGILAEAMGNILIGQAFKIKLQNLLFKF